MNKTCIAVRGLLGLILATPTLAQSTHDVTVGPDGLNTFSPDAIVITVGDTVRYRDRPHPDRRRSFADRAWASRATS